MTPWFWTPDRRGLPGLSWRVRRIIRWNGGEKLPVYRNREGADTTLIFTVEDAEKYWQRRQLVIRVLEAATEREVERLQGDNPKLRWEDAGDLHTGQLEFDGEPGQEGCYRVELACPIGRAIP